MAGQGATKGKKKKEPTPIYQGWSKKERANTVDSVCPPWKKKDASDRPAHLFLGEVFAKGYKCRVLGEEN